MIEINLTFNEASWERMIIKSTIGNN